MQLTTNKDETSFRRLNNILTTVFRPQAKENGGQAIPPFYLSGSAKVTVGRKARKCFESHNRSDGAVVERLPHNR